VINILAVARPDRKKDATGICDPIHPFLCLEVEKQKLLHVDRKSSQVKTIRGPAGREQVLRAGKCRNLFRMKIQNLKGEFPRARRDPERSAEYHLLAIGRPLRIELRV